MSAFFIDIGSYSFYSLSFGILDRDGGEPIKDNYFNIIKEKEEVTKQFGEKPFDLIFRKSIYY